VVVPKAANATPTAQQAKPQAKTEQIKPEPRIEKPKAPEVIRGQEMREVERKKQLDAESKISTLREALQKFQA